MELPITGQRISTTVRDHLVELVTTAGFVVQIEGTMQIESERGDRRTVSLAAGDATRAGLESALRGSVTAATVGPSGVLTVDLDSALRLVVPPDDKYEAWSLTGPNGYRVVCVPGGETTVWTAG
ncbi:DUF6188 family protein [Nocardia asteroides]|uniref:DUF6188 family protein n=1 Tax=Nocardia asteroides TaxID=1824 RepID=UPI001E5D6C15|nr:DUF6188 family protein [Nocardia asteroides]UGT60692.1 DUF6188 family protein [Nocardia asteroides]